MVDFDPTKIAELKQGIADLQSGIITMDELKSKVGELGISFGGLSTAFAGTGQAATTTNQTLAATSKVTADLSQNFGPLGAAGRTLGNMFKGLASNIVPILGLTTKLGQSLADPLGKFLNYPSVIGRANTAILALRNAQMTARDSSALFGGTVKDTMEAATPYPQTLRRMASAFGITTQQLDNMNKQARMVPGALTAARGQFKELAGVSAASVQPTAILATTMKGMGFTAREAGSMASRSWLNFGQRIPETVREMGKMSAAAQETGVDTKTTTEQIVRASSSLAIFGRGAASAAAVWQTFTTALKSGGVPIKQIGDIVGQVTDGIAKMSVQQRAFISMMGGRSGGRGALAGALKMELEMRQPGGMNRQLQDLTRTLARFGGGRIITLEQAVKQPGMEQQFLLQRQMLGKLGIQGTAEQQNRILEVLNKVQSGGMTQVEGTDAMKRAFDTGKSVQERSLTTLQRMEQHLRAMVGGEGMDQGIDRIDEALREQPDRISGMGMMGRGAAETSSDRSLRESGQFRTGGSQFLRDIKSFPGRAMPSAKMQADRPRESITDFFRSVERGAGKLETKATRGAAPMRAPTSPTFRALTTTVRSGDARKVVLLRQIRDLTRDSVRPLQALTGVATTGGTNPTSTATTTEAGETTNTLVIKIVGDGKNVQDQMYKMNLGRQG